MPFVLWSGGMGFSSFPEPVLNFPPSSPTSTETPQVGDAEVGGLSGCGHA